MHSSFIVVLNVASFDFSFDPADVFPDDIPDLVLAVVFFRIEVRQS